MRDYAAVAVPRPGQSLTLRMSVPPRARVDWRRPPADRAPRGADRAPRDEQCPGNPEKTRGFRTLEASISVGFQSIREPLIISARGLEIWTQKSLASTRTKSC